MLRYTATGEKIADHHRIKTSSLAASLLLFFTFNVPSCRAVIIHSENLLDGTVISFSRRQLLVYEINTSILFNCRRIGHRELLLFFKFFNAIFEIKRCLQK